MLDHGKRAIQTGHGGDGHGDHGGTGPDQHWFAFHIDPKGLSSWGEIHSGTDCFLPPVAVESVIGEASDDPIRRH
jgi:hypothetical protein